MPRENFSKLVPRLVHELRVTNSTNDQRTSQIIETEILPDHSPAGAVNFELSTIENQVLNTRSALNINQPNFISNSNFYSNEQLSPPLDINHMSNYDQTLEYNPLNLSNLNSTDSSNSNSIAYENDNVFYSSDEVNSSNNASIYSNNSQIETSSSWRMTNINPYLMPEMNSHGSHAYLSYDIHCDNYLSQNAIPNNCCPCEAQFQSFLTEGVQRNCSPPPAYYSVNYANNQNVINREICSGNEESVESNEFHYLEFFLVHYKNMRILYAILFVILILIYVRYIITDMMKMMALYVYGAIFVALFILALLVIYSKGIINRNYNNTKLNLFLNDLLAAVVFLLTIIFLVDMMKFAIINILKVRKK